MQLTLSIASAPSPQKPNASAPSTVRADKGNFAALLSSFEIGTLAQEINKDASSKSSALKKKDGEKRHAKPDVNKDPTFPPLPVIELPALLKQEALPISLKLMLPVALPENLSGTAPKNDSPEPPEGLKPASPKPEVQLAPAAIPIVLSPITLPAPPLFPQAMPQTSAHIPAKPKAAGPLELEKLTALRLPLKDTPKDTPHTEIAFEATLKPAQPEVPASLFKPPPDPLQLATPREDPKTPDKQIPQEIKPEHSNDEVTPASIVRATATPHIEPSPVKTMETPAVSVSATHPDKPAIPAPKTQTSASASTLADLPDLPAPRTEPARDISFRIASTPSDAVDVKLVDRGGQIHVAVRSTDPLLTQSLQANVTELAGKLEKAGYETETLIPNRPEPVQPPQQNATSYNFQQDRRAPQQEPQSRKKPGAAPTETFTLNPLQETA